MEFAVGAFGVALAWALAGAQWWRARSSSEGISALSWAVFLATNLVWLVYGLGVANPYLVINAVGSAALNTSLLWRIDPHRWRTYALVASYTLAGAAVAAVLGLPALAVMCFLTAFVVRWPQLVRAVRAADLSGISLTSWVLALANNAVWAAVGLQRDDVWLAVANGVIGASTLALIAVVVVRRRGTGHGSVVGELEQPVRGSEQ